MIFDLTTGIFTLDGGTTLGSATTRAAFVATPEGQAAARWSNKGYRFHLADGAWLLVLSFSGAATVSPALADDRLEQVWFSVSGLPYATSWDDWTAAKEQARHAANVAWLARQGVVLQAAGNQSSLAEYAWGQVRAFFDFKDGGWNTLVSYARP